MDRDPSSAQPRASGRAPDLRRPRWSGPLDSAELEYSRRHSIALAYDPVQIGWVLAGSPETADVQGRTTVPPGSADSAPTRVQCTLRPWRTDDIAAFRALLDNPRVWEFLPEPYPAPLTDEVVRGLIELSNGAEHHEVRAIEVDGEAVGQVRLAFDPGGDDRSEGEISYWLGEPHWGRGIGSQVVSLYTAACFRSRPDLESVVARVHGRNAASARVLEKAGYRQEAKRAEDPVIRTFRKRRH